MYAITIPVIVGVFGAISKRGKRNFLKMRIECEIEIFSESY